MSFEEFVEHCRAAVQEYEQTILADATASEMVQVVLTEIYQHWDDAHQFVDLDYNPSLVLLDDYCDGNFQDAVVISRVMDELWPVKPWDQEGDYWTQLL